jgi:RNA polymerase sigma-70 factor, ECF subfamily
VKRYDPSSSSPTEPSRAATYPCTAPDEAALLVRLRRGDDDAFDELVRLAGPQLLVVARRLLLCEEDARDAVQEGFLCAFRSLDQFDGRARLTTWLHRIVVNAALMRRRSQRRRPEQSIDELLPEFLPDGHQKNPAQTWKPPEDCGIEREELRALVRRRIAELPDSYRVILMLREIEGLSTEETGSALGISIAAVKTRLHRARQALRELLEPQFTEMHP